MMNVESIECYSSEQLIAELVSRTTFVGVVFWYRGCVDDCPLDPARVKVAKAPTLEADAAEWLLRTGLEGAAQQLDE